MSERLNLLAPEFLSNPYPHFAELRRRTPVCQVDPGGMWAVTRHEDCLGVLKNPKLFSSEGLARSMEPPWLGHNPVARSTLVMDPPSHGRSRALVSRAFTPATIARLEPLIRSRAEQLVDTMVERRTVDFLPALAQPIAATVIGHLMGLDASLYPRFHHWSDHLAAVSATSAVDTARQQEIRGTVREMEGYLREVVEQRRRTRGDDLVSDLLAARVDDEALTEAELMSFLFLLLPAGLETTTNLLGNSAAILADHPEMLERLRAEPALVPSFIEEVLRCESPVQSTFRLTTAETELGGVKLPQHTLLILLIGSACRDEAYLPDAERFVLGRKEPTNLAFGYGIHFCVGAALARLEARVTLEVLLSRVRALSRRPGPLAWHPSIQIRGLTQLPVEVLPA